MNLSTLTLTEDEIEQGLAEQLANPEPNQEDRSILRALRAAKRGHPLIMLSECIRAGGTFEDGLPRLAVVRCGAKTVGVRTEWGSRDLIYISDPDTTRPWNDGRRNRGALVNERTVRVRDVVEPAHRPRNGGTTVVPLVPPRHRPSLRREHMFHILWEVEAWTPAPPTDPALIHHVRGDLWAVLVTWDLTELERAVLAGRVTS